LGEWNGDALEPFEEISERKRSVKKILLDISQESLMLNIVSIECLWIEI